MPKNCPCVSKILSRTGFEINFYQQGPHYCQHKTFCLTVRLVKGLDERHESASRKTTKTLPRDTIGLKKAKDSETYTLVIEKQIKRPRRSNNLEMQQ